MAFRLNEGLGRTGCADQVVVALKGRLIPQDGEATLLEHRWWKRRWQVLRMRGLLARIAYRKHTRGRIGRALWHSPCPTRRAQTHSLLRDPTAVLPGQRSGHPNQRSHLFRCGALPTGQSPVLNAWLHRRRGAKSNAQVTAPRTCVAWPPDRSLTDTALGCRPTRKDEG